jgi:hypothetical protein
MYIDGAYCAWRPLMRSRTWGIDSPDRRSRSWRSKRASNRCRWLRVLI